MSQAITKNSDPDDGDTGESQSGGVVHIKGEIHSSRGDQHEEQELMRSGIDALVLEGRKSTGEYTITEGWFQQAISGTFYILSPLYVSKELLVDFAELQDAEVYFTRNSDAEVLRNAPLPVRAISAGLYFLLLPSSVIVGLLTGNYLSGAGFLAVSFLVPVLLLRLYNTGIRSSELNRDKIIAGKIVEASKHNDSVLAVVGDAHTEGVIDALPDSVNVRYHCPEYGRISKPHLKEIAVPVFQMFSLLLTLYLAILWSVTRIAGFL